MIEEAINRMRAAGFVVSCVDYKLSIEPRDRLTRKQIEWVDRYHADLLECIRKEQYDLDTFNGVEISDECLFIKDDAARHIFKTFPKQLQFAMTVGASRFNWCDKTWVDQINAVDAFRKAFNMSDVELVAGYRMTPMYLDVTDNKLKQIKFKRCIDCQYSSFYDNSDEYSMMKCSRKDTVAQFSRYEHCCELFKEASCADAVKTASITFSKEK